MIFIKILENQDYFVGWAIYHNLNIREKIQTFINLYYPKYLFK